MSNYDEQKSNDNLVDISSGKQIRKIYSKKGRIRRIICVVLSVLLMISGGGMVYYYSVLNSLNFQEITDKVVKSDKKDVSSTTPTYSEVEGDGTNLSLSDGELLQDSKVLNIMLFGEDNSGDDEYGRSDTMIMMSIDNRHQKLKLTSFQRDTYVYIPGYGYNKSLIYLWGCKTCNSND
jgi:anionic cell wall polymer biosynthesis LytR-Cps2A-Psr (LCP) family protein